MGGRTEYMPGGTGRKEPLCGKYLGDPGRDPYHNWYQAALVLIAQNNIIFPVTITRSKDAGLYGGGVLTPAGTVCDDNKRLELRS